MLGDINGWHMLDLFAGSGIMAIEALSRGAASVTSIEQHHKACQHIQACCHQFGLSDCQIIRGSLPATLSRVENQPFELIFADPPYQQDMAEKIPLWIDEHGIHCRQLVIEESSRARPVWPENWTLTRSRRYGDTTLHFLTIHGVEQENAS